MIYLKLAKIDNKIYPRMMSSSRTPDGEAQFLGDLS